ncbi:uncharacterized protein L199_002100 [Kwoniella botswanensis]|uniref:uncharacterized protein n=1 Tax=Kwoniella botswanensis TaxID=1268659 RepID=UPI00315D0DF7
MGTVDFTQYVPPYMANSTTHRRLQSRTETQTDRSRIPVMLLFHYNSCFPRLEDVSVDNAQSPRAFLLEDVSNQWAFRLAYHSGDGDNVDDYLWQRALALNSHLNTVFTSGDIPQPNKTGMSRPTDGTSIFNMLENFVVSRHESCSQAITHWFKLHRRSVGMTKHDVRFKVVHDRSEFESAPPSLSSEEDVFPEYEQEYQDYMRSLEGYTFCDLKGEPLPSTVSKGWIWPVNAPSQKADVGSWYSWCSILPFTQ